MYLKRMVCSVQDKASLFAKYNSMLNCKKIESLYTLKIQTIHVKSENIKIDAKTSDKWDASKIMFNIFQMHTNADE